MVWQRKSGAPLIVVTSAGWWALILARFPWLQYLAPGLAGEIIDVTSFCAAGPEWTPPVTMADITWIGVPPLGWTRPFTLLDVTRAIARQEAFALYCEIPGNPTPGWHVVDEGCWSLTQSGQDVVIMTGIALPNSSTKVRFTYTSGPYSAVHTAVTGGGRHIEQTGIDSLVLPETGKLTGPDVPLGQTVEQDFTDWRSTNQSFTVWPALYVGGGNSPPAAAVCGLYEWFGSTSTATYDPGAAVEDPNVTLPDGTGSTIDQLEVKLDLIQQMLKQRGVGQFNLDPTSMTGVGEQVAGDLLDAVGLLLLVEDLPSTRSSWSSDPPRFPEIARVTLGNEDGWWPSIDVEHPETVILPLPAGATRFSVVCQPPMRASVTLYRPTS